MEKDLRSVPRPPVFQLQESSCNTHLSGGGVDVSHTEVDGKQQKLRGGHR